ncbi:MAG: sigma-70 family RNA polymerase sigma factor [Chloroflexota bacterium]
MSNELEITITQAQSGNLEAFNTIVHRFQDMAVGYAYSNLHDLQLAEDAAQEAFVEAYRCLPTLREPIAFAAWFRRIIFKHVDRLTRRKQVMTVALEVADYAPCTQGNAEIVAQLEAEEMREELMGMVHSLPDEERTVITLFYMGGYAHQDIADFLDMPKTTVNNRLRSAKKRLKQEMMTMIQDNLQEKRPSNDDAFAKRVMAFVRATEAGDALQVKTMLMADNRLAHASGPSRFGRWVLPPLHLAAMYGFQDVMTALLEYGVDINLVDERGWRAVHCALRAGQSEAAQFLIAHGAAVDIFAAVQLGDIQQVQTFLTADPSLITATGPMAATPLHFASQMPMVELLLAHNVDGYRADIHARDVEGRTAVTWQSDQLDVAQMLIAHGAKVEDIFLACAVGDVERVQTFLAENPTLLQTPKGLYKGNVMHITARGGHVDVAQFLLSQGADVNSKAEDGDVTPLHIAAAWGQLGMIRFLLDNGANAVACDTEFNATPTGWAKFWKRDEAATLLEQLA